MDEKEDDYYCSLQKKEINPTILVDKSWWDIYYMFRNLKVRKSINSKRKRKKMDNLSHQDIKQIQAYP